MTTQILINEEEMKRVPSHEEISYMTEGLSFPIEETIDPHKKRRYTTRAISKEVRSKLKDLSTSDEPRLTMFTYSIDPSDYTDAYLIQVGIHIFSYYNLLQIYHINEENLTNFFFCVCSLYNAGNHFHNFKHAFGVMHMCFHILINGADEYLDSFDIFAILVAAICHDLGHPGNTNAFELATNTHVSMLYSDPNEMCVLEKYHASLSKALLLSEGSYTHGLLASFAKDEKEIFFTHVNFIIMGTDMAKHSSLVEEARGFVADIINQKLTEGSNCGIAFNGTPDDSPTFRKGKARIPRSRSAAKKLDALALKTTSIDSTETNSASQSPSASTTPSSSIDGLFDRSSKVGKCLLPTEESRMRLTRIIVHCCDIGAQTQEKSVACRWAKRCYAEFLAQVNNEKKLGIVTSPFLHTLDEEIKIFASQTSFINDTVEPIWTVITTLVPNLNFALKQLQENKQFYKDLISLTR